LKHRKLAQRVRIRVAALLTEQREAGVQEAANANSSIASAPNYLPAQLPPVPAVVGAATNQLDLRSVLQCLERFMEITNLAAEVCLQCSSDTLGCETS